MAGQTIFSDGKTGLANSRSINLLLTDYKRFVGVVRKQQKRIMLGAAKIVADETIVPFEFGGLQESMRIFTIESDKGVSGIVTFGGPSAEVLPTPNAPEGFVDYAVVVHETAPHQGFLFLGGQAAAPKVERFIARELKAIT